MDRRDLMKSSLCFLGGAWICCGQGFAGTEKSVGPPDAKIHTDPDLSKRTFPLKLRPFWMSSYDTRLHWLKSMLERFGNELTLTIWSEAFRPSDGGLLERILAEGWEPYSEEEPGQAVSELLEGRFASPVEGVTKAEARKLVELEAAITFPKKRFPTLMVRKEIDTYSSLHLRLDGIARLVETMVRRLGKEGELVAYDIIRAYRAERAARQPREVADVIKEWAGSVESEERNAFTAGLEVVLVRASDTEAVMHVKACEWARYFTERHPTVAYLVSCSTDDAGLRATNDKLRMQRTSTIMEGGDVCDFRVYSV